MAVISNIFPGVECDVVLSGGISEHAIVVTTTPQGEIIQCNEKLSDLSQYTHEDLRREFLTEKSCAPMCTVSCVHMTSLIDFWRAPQTLKSDPSAVNAGRRELVNIQTAGD